MIPQETVDRIIDSAQIAEVVGEFVPLKRRGANYVACCPFHNEKTPSFYVSPAKGIYKCFGCGKSGTAVGFVMEHESLTYAEALKYLARKYGIEVVEKEESAEDIALRQRNESLLLVSEFAGKFFQESLSSTEGRTYGYEYFKSRGLEDDTIAKFALGWAPISRTAFATAARNAGYKEEYLVDTGLCNKRDDGSLSDRFYDRVVFPIHSLSGRIIAFGCRTLKKDKSIAKYVNSPETEIYDKSRTLYALYQAKNEISRQNDCILSEGYLDVISMHQLGITNVVASCGTSLTPQQVKLIHKFTENVTIMYDGDQAGINAALKAIGLILKEGMNPKVVLIPDGDDPDSFSRKHTLSEVRDFIEANRQDFISFKAAQLLGDSRDPLKKAEMINDIADTIALVADPVKRAMYVDFCSERFKIDQQILYERISRVRGEMLLEEGKQKERERKQKESARRREEETESNNEGRTVSDFTELSQKEVLAAYSGGKFNDPFLEPCERELLWFIVMHGTAPLVFDSDSSFYVAGEEVPTVAEFIDSALSNDGIEFSNDIYRKVYGLYFELYDEGFEQEKITGRLLNCVDRDVADVTLDLMAEKYTITVENYKASLTKDSTLLVMFVPKAILAYQVKRIDKQLSELVDDMRKNPDDALLVKIDELAKIRQAIESKKKEV